MIQINPLKSYIDGGVRAAITTPPSASLVFDLPGKAIWVKGVKLKGTDHTYTFSHDNYITLTNTPDSNESEDIKIGVNTSALKNAIDTTYGVVSTAANGLAPKFTSGNKLAASAATTYYFLGWAGSTLKWYQAPFRNIRINSETTDRLGVNSTDPLIISSGNGISVTWDSTNKKIIITNTKPDVNHNTHYTTMLYIGENNDTKANKNVANPYLKLFDDNTRRAIFQIKAGNGIAVASDANGNITITNSSPDVNHNTDRTGIKLTTVSGTKKTDSTLILANSTTGLNIQGGTNKFLIGNGTNYIEVPVVPSVSNKDATIGTTLTTLATIAGVDIKAKIAPYSLSNHTHSVKINGSTKTIAAPGGTAIDLGSYLSLSGGTMTGNIILKGGTSADMTYAGNAHPYIRFDNSDSSQNVSLIFTDYDAYRSTAGIKLVGNQGNEWFEAANIYATIFHGALSGNASSATALTTSAGSATLPIYFSGGKPVACTALSLFSNLSNSGNNISVTIAGLNRTLTVNYASNSSSAEYLNNYSIGNPNTEALKDNKVKWFAQINLSSGYAGNNYGFPVSNNANGILYLGTHPGKYGYQLGFSSNGNIYYRYQNGSDFPLTANGGSWSVLLTSTNYASILDSRYYTESEINNLLSNKLNISNFNWTNLSGKIVAGNEFNIVNAGYNSSMWFNFLPINDRSKTATIAGYHFGNGASGYTSIKASGFIKNGSSSSYVLLGDGGHKLISDFALASTLNNYVTITTTQTITGVKTFANNTFILSGVEHNDIKHATQVLYNWGGYGENSTPIHTGMYNSLDFYWYNDIWSIGNLRSGGASTQGFGIGLKKKDSNNNLYFAPALRITETASYINNNIIWHAGNDGSGSGLDADLLDGNHASAFATAGHTHSNYVTALGTNGNYLTWTKNGNTSNITIPYATSATNADKLDGYHANSFSLTGHTHLYVVTTSFNGLVGGTVATYKTNIHSTLSGMTGIGKHIVVSDSIIGNWSNNSASYTPSSVSSIISINGGYDGRTYGQFLVSSWNYGLGLLIYNNGSFQNIKWFSTVDHTHSYLPLSGGTMSNTNKVTNLNADLLDGYHASSFATASHIHTDTFSIAYNANYVVLSFRDSALSKKASETYIECWDSDGGWWNWKANKWIKVGSNDSYVLLGGGGHKAESSLSVNYASSSGNASSAGNADTVDGYHASSLWRSNGATWNPGANVSLNASANGQEWSFDIRRNGYTGCYWRVWDSSLSTMLKVNADNGKVYAPYNFVGNLEGNASSSSKLQTARTIWGQSFDGTGDVSGTLSGVANILFNANNTYDIGSNSAASRYIYTYWLGAKSGLKLELGANNSNFGLGLCIDTNLNVGIGINTPSYKLHVIGDIYTTTGFKKNGSSNSYVLLGGGGHKTLNDFSMAHSHPYLSLSGGTMTGPIKFSYNNNGNCNVSRTSGFSMFYGNLENATNYGFPFRYSSVISFMTEYCGMQFANYGGNGDTRLLFRNISDLSKWTNWYHILHSGNSSVTKSGQTITVTINGTSQSLTNSTYNFSGASFTSGNYNTAEHNANNITSNGVWYYTSNGPTTSLGVSTNDGALYSQAYNTNWVGQIALDYINGNLFVRGKNNGTWQAWRGICWSDNYALRFHYSNLSNSPTYLWATNSNGYSFLAARASISVNYANSAGNADTVDGYHASSFATSGHNHNSSYVSSLTTSGNSLRWVKNGSNNDITIPYATNAANITGGPIKTLADPGVSLLIKSYGLRSDYTSAGYPTEEYLKAWCKYAYANCSGKVAIGYVNPNSRGFIFADIYASGINNSSGLPEHITGRYYSHGGNGIKFGTSYGTWYYGNTDTNTWRGIQNNLTSTSTTDSLSANQGRLLANGSARDNTKLPLSGGTMTGTIYFGSMQSGKDAGINCTLGSRNMLFGIGTSGNAGMWEPNKGWIMGMDTSNNVFIHGNADTATTASQVKDAGNGSAITFKYSSGGFTSKPSWLAAWNGYQLTYVSPSILSVSHAAAVTVNNSDANSTYRMVWHSGNTLYGTNNIYCNPSSDQIYSAGFRHVSYNSASYLLRSDGGAAAFNWSGQGGQPTWLWGGNSQHTYYVYNPSNFNVNSAAVLRGNASNPNNSHPGHGAKVFYSWNTGQAGNDTTGYSNGITIGSNPSDTAYGFQIVQNMWDDRTYTRRYNKGWQSWKTLAWTSDIPTVTNYYWANIKVSASSSTSTSPTFSTCYTSNWFRSTGLTGWYNETYGGGWYMNDVTWIRTHNNKGIYTNTGTIYNAGHAWLATSNGYNVGIGTTSPSYKLHIAGDGYSTGWFRSNNGLYCEGTGVHFTHNNSLTSAGEIDITSNNEFCWGSSNGALYFNYRGVSRGKTVTSYVWNAGSSTSYASHTTGHITLGNSGYLLKRVGCSVTWVNGRNSAIVRQTSANGYSVVVSSKTVNGSWEIGNYTNNGDSLYFTHITDSNYNSGNNTVSGQVYFNSSGSIYANSLNASNNVNATGSMYAAHFYENSDIRYKRILKNLSINSNIIANLPLFDFEWIENNAIGTGTSALAVQQILPNLVSGTDKLTLDYGVLGTIAGITACKELVKVNTEIFTLKSELLQLKEKVKLLEDKLRKYENI